MENRYIESWFQFYETSATFKAHLDGGFINPDSICFLKETNQVYTQGTFFGVCSKEFRELVFLVGNHDAMLKNIIGSEGPSVDDGIINNLKEIENFLSGISTDETLTGMLDALNNALTESINDVAKDLDKKYKELSIKIVNLTNDLEERSDRINADIARNKSDIDSLRIKNEALESTVRAHLVEWEGFKATYNTFKSYVDGRLDALDATSHTLRDDITRYHLELEEIKEKIVDFDLKVEQSNNLAQNCLVLVNQVEQKFDELTKDVNDFVNTKGHPNGLAPLDSEGKVPSTHLPSYVDDVLEYPNIGAFPADGETGKIYVALDTNLTYRWSGTQYVEISKSLAIGETATTAYPGDKGKAVADGLEAHKLDHTNPHQVTKAQIGLDKVNNTSDEDKPISKPQQAALDVLTNSLDGHINDHTNPHDVTKEQIGLGRVDNTNDLEKPISNATQDVLDTKVDKVAGKGLSTNDFTNDLKFKLETSLSVRQMSSEDIGKIPEKIVGEPIYNTTENKYVYWDGEKWKEVAEADVLRAHIENKSNPHEVTKAQVGLGNVDNTSDADKPISTAQQEAFTAGAAALTAHTSNKNNPHEVTKAQVGLGNVDNTSDANKPVSTAQQAALDGKVDKVSGKGLSTNDYTTDEKNKLAGVAANANNYSLPTSSASTKGGVKVGDRLTMSGEVLSADEQIKWKTIE